jgi:hypothetical protein
MQGNAREERWCCVHCGDAIGAYEPIVQVGDGDARRTSRTQETRSGRPAGEYFHHACYVSVHGEPPE